MEELQSVNKLPFTKEGTRVLAWREETSFFKCIVVVVGRNIAEVQETG